MHEAVDPPLGDRREVRQRDGEEVERHRDRLAMEVAAAQQLAAVGEDERVVGRRVELAAHHAGAEVDRVEHGTVHLRHAAQRSTGPARADRRSRCDSRISLSSQQLAQQRRARRLTELAARILDARVECDRRAEQRLERHRAGEMRHLPQPMRVDDRQRGDARCAPACR